MPDEAGVTQEEVDAAISGDETRPAWEFWDQPPTLDEVRELLETLPPVYGVRTVDYIDYVQALPQTKTLPGPLVDERGKRGPETKRETWSLYMSVGGRIKMLQAAQELNGWEVDFRPEMHVPPDCPVGFLEFGERLVYREYCVISEAVSKAIVNGAGDPVQKVLGSKPGMAWVPRAGGRQAKGSNPYEKVETAARGRSIAAWGFGVLPGSGVASLEEMQGVGDNLRGAAADEQPGQQRAGGSRKTRDDLLQETLLLGEQLKQAAGMDDETFLAGVVKYLTENLGVKNAVFPDGSVDWSKVKDGQLQMVAGMYRQRLTRVHAVESPMGGDV